MGAGDKSIYEDYSRVISDSSGLFDLFFDQDDMNYFLNEIRRRHEAMLLNDAEDVQFLARKVTGNKCPHIGPRSSRECPRPLVDPACYGTGIIGGYESPFSIKVRLASLDLDTLPEVFGRRTERIPRSWTLWEPKLKEHDILVTKRNEWFEIQHVTAFRVRGEITYQQFDTRKLQPDDPATHFPMNITYK